MPKVRFTLVLNTEKHAALIAQIEAQPNKSAFILAALMRGQSGDERTITEVYDLLMTMKSNGVAAGLSEHDGEDEPQDMFDALENLG